MKVEWRQLLRGHDPAHLDAAIYVSLTAKLLRISPGVTVLEALLIGLVGGYGAWRVRDPILSILCLATTVTVLLLPLLPRRFEALAHKEAEVGRVRRIETWFSIHIWLASIGIGAMTARALLAFDDPILHLNLIALILGAAVTTIRDHYRPLVPFGKAIALLGPTAVALMLTGQPYYLVLALGAVLMTKVILDLALELYRASLDVHQVLAEKARLADALRVRADELQRVRSELMAASRLTAMGTMASALAHELNQPLAAICNYTRAARRHLESQDADDIRLAGEGIGQAEEAAHRAGEIVRRIRSFVSGDGTPRKPEDLAAIVEEACAFGLAEARTQGVHQEIRIAPNEYEVLVDRIQIQQVLINLLQNAVDALKLTPMPRIVVSARAENGCAIVTVADNGAGVSGLAQQTLFEPFSTTKDNGMGMGLAISRTIIEAHEGRLSWSVGPENETLFSFSIPLVPHDGRDSSCLLPLEKA